MALPEPLASAGSQDSSGTLVENSSERDNSNAQPPEPLNSNNSTTTTNNNEQDWRQQLIATNNREEEQRVSTPTSNAVDRFVALVLNASENEDAPALLNQPTQDRDPLSPTLQRETIASASTDAGHSPEDEHDENRQDRAAESGNGSLIATVHTNEEIAHVRAPINTGQTLEEEIRRITAEPISARPPRTTPQISNIPAPVLSNQINATEESETLRELRTELRAAQARQRQEDERLLRAQVRLERSAAELERLLGSSISETVNRNIDSRPPNDGNSTSDDDLESLEELERNEPEEPRNSRNESTRLIELLAAFDSSAPAAPDNTTATTSDDNARTSGPVPTNGSGLEVRARQISGETVGTFRTTLAALNFGILDENDTLNQQATDNTVLNQSFGRDLPALSHGRLDPPSNSQQEAAEGGHQESHSDGSSSSGSLPVLVDRRLIDEMPSDDSGDGMRGNEPPPHVDDDDNNSESSGSSGPPGLVPRDRSISFGDNDNEGFAFIPPDLSFVPPMMTAFRFSRSYRPKLSLKCPLCSCEHEKTNPELTCSKGSRFKMSHDARAVFPDEHICCICWNEEVESPMVALGCGHIVCRDDFKKLGGKVVVLDSPATSQRQTTHGTRTRAPPRPQSNQPLFFPGLRQRDAETANSDDLEIPPPGSRPWEDPHLSPFRTDPETGLPLRDIELVMSQADCPREAAVRALVTNDGDLVNSIMSLSEISRPGSPTSPPLPPSPTDPRTGLPVRDIELVMSQADCSREVAVRALFTHGGDLVSSIMSLTADE